MPLPVSPTILLAAASIALLCGHYLPIRIRWVTGYALLIVALIASYCLSAEPVISSVETESSTLRSAWKNDGLAFCEQWTILAFGLLTGACVLSSPAQTYNPSKVGGFLLFALAGMMLVATANDFLALGLSFEIVNLAIRALQRHLEFPPFQKGSTAASDETSDERRSAIVWFNWLSSALMWLGIALFANATAATNFDELRSILTDAYDPGANQTAIGAPSKLILLASGLISMSLFARMGLVPFHLCFVAEAQCRSNWTSLYGLLALQLAGAMALTRLFGHVFVGLGQSIVVLAIVVTLATFTLSAIAARRGLTQGARSFRDLVSSLILLHGGWLVIGPMIVAIELSHPALRWGAFPNQPESVTIIVFTQITGVLAGCGVCSALCHLTRADRRVEFLEDVKGLGQLAPLTSIALLTGLASFAACPWTAGFWGRWLTLLAGHNVHVKSTSSILTPHYGVRMAILAGILASLVFAAIVLRLAREILLESPLARHPATGGRGPLMISLTTAFVSVLFGIAPHLALGPLKIIHSPRAVIPRDPERGSGRNSLGSVVEPVVPKAISASRQ